MMLPPPFGVRFPPDVTLGIQAKEFNLGFIRPENLVSHGLRGLFMCFLANSKWDVMCLLLRSGFSLATLQQRPVWMECCRDGYPSVTFSSTQELCHLLDQGSSPQIAQFSRAASSRKSLGGYKLLPLKNDGGHCVFGDFQCCRIFFGTLNQIRASTLSCLFCSDMRCQLWDLI